MVFHTTVIEDIATNLATPFDFLLTGFHLCLLGHTVLEFLVVKHGTEKQQCLGTVLGLVTCLGIFDQDFFFLAGIRVGIPIAQTDTGLYLIDILTTGTTQRKVSQESLAGSTYTSMVSSTSGVTKTLAKLVIRLPWALKGETRTSRCTPFSLFR